MTSDQQPLDTTGKLTERLDIDFALQAAGLGVWEIAPATNQVIWDQRCQALVGLNKDNTIPFQEVIQYIYPDDFNQVISAIQWAITPESGGTFDQTYRTLGADGKLRLVRFWGQAHFTLTGELYRFAGVAQEVTQQMIDKHKVEASEQILRDMVLKAPIGISVLNAADLVIEIVNPSFIEVAGKPHEELIGKNYWVPFAEAAPYYEEALNRVAQEGEPFYANEVELMLIRHGQEEIIYVTFVYMPIKDATGIVRKIAIWVLENTYQVTERQKIEKLIAERIKELNEAYEKLTVINEQLAINNDKMEEANYQLRRSNGNLEQFAYVASHDLQEPLRKIQTFGDLLYNQYQQQLGAGTDYLHRMQVATTRMSILIKDLLAFSRISIRQEAPKPVSLDKVLQAVTTDLELVIAESEALIEIAPLPVVLGDESQLERLFQNLLSNALKFSQQDETGNRVTPHIRVSAQLVLKVDLPSSVHFNRSIPQFHRIDVADNGIGFDEKYLDRIFQVFQRLHSRSEFAGTGIGLAICERVVVNHDGAITASSRPGYGTTFRVYLPA